MAADTNGEETVESSRARPPRQIIAARHGWQVLGILSLLMGFASISTDLYLPAMPAMGRSLGASPGSVEWTISGYLIHNVLTDDDGRVEVKFCPTGISCSISFINNA